MKRFSEVQKKSRVLRRINESESNLPSNYEELSKEELIKLMSGQSKSEETEEKEEQEERGEEPKGKNGDVSKFISKIFESRQMAHVYHLQVKGDMGSHAKHIALQEYYEGDDEGEGGVLDSLDTLIEIYQAQYGLIEGYDIIDTKESNSKDPIEYFMDLGKFIKSERKNCFNEEDTEFFNIIDDILVLIYQTIYKLKFTK
jgi:hypothetical protein